MVGKLKAGILEDCLLVTEEALEKEEYCEGRQAMAAEAKRSRWLSDGPQEAASREPGS